MLWSIGVFLAVVAVILTLQGQRQAAVKAESQYQAKLQAERLAAVGQTIATLSHHIKNILQGIRGGSYLIELGLAEHDETLVSKGWRIVDKNQSKITNLMMDMLTFSKEREPDPRPSDLNAVAAEVIDLMASRAEEMSVELVWRPARTMPTLMFDPEALNQLG